MKRKKLWLLCFQITCFTLAQECFSLPKDHQVAHGSAQIKHIDPFTMEIHPSDQAIINYSAFDISRHEKVCFIQNSNSSCVLNRVVGNDPSQIFGSLESNGKVFLVNPNGVYFGPDSTVNVGSFIASTLDIADEDFLAENYRFSLTKNAEIRNEGFLSSIEGSIVLMAPQVRNSGLIEAKAGTVLLASGNHVTLDFVGDGLVQFAVEGSLKEALIEHLGQIKGSLVSLKLPTAKQAIEEIVNVEGIQEGDVFTEENGIIKFVAGSTLLAQKTHLEASQLSIEGSIKGNEVHLLGKDIVLQGAEIDVSSPEGGGEVLIGGDCQGKGTTPYAQTVTMDEISNIFASALENGDGGLVVLWSKDRTVFNGNIEAHGGPLGGDGGLIETSSVGGLGISTGRVGALAPKGKMGDWLLDPEIAFIVSDGSSKSDCPSCSSSFGDCSDTVTCCLVFASAIQNATANVTVQATDGINLGIDIIMANDNVGITLGGCPTVLVEIIGSIATRSGPVTILGDIVSVDGGSQTAGTVTIDTTYSLSTAPGVPSAGADINCLNVERNSSITGTAIFNLNAGTAGILTVGTSGSAYLGTINVSSAYQIKTPGIQLANPGNLYLSSLNGVLVTSSTTTFSVDQNLTINTTIDAQDSGSYALIIENSSSASTTILGAIGGTSPLASVMISGLNTTSFNSITVSGGDVTISSPAIINSDSVITSNGGDISFTSTLSDITAGGDTLELIAGGGAITFTAAIGAFGSFTITSASAVNLPVSITGYDLVSITPDLTLTGSSAIQIQATNGDISLGAITSSTAQDFTCISSGDTTVGALTSLGDVNILADAINLNDTVTATSLTLVNTGTLTVNGATIDLSGGDLNQSGGGGVTLATTTINTGGGDVTFAGALNPLIAGSSNLTIVAGTGLVTLSGSVGYPGFFGSVTITSGSAVDLGSSVGAVNTISITPNILLSGASTIQSVSGSVTLPNISSTNSSSLVGYASSTLSVGTLSGLGNINLTGTTVTLGGSVTSSTSLTITDSTSLSIISGDITIAGSFTQTGGGAVTLGNNITVGGGISFADQVSLTSNQTVYLTASGSPGIVLSGDVIGSGGGYNLVLTSYAYGVNAQNLGTDGNPLGILSLVSNVNSSFTAIALVGIVEVFAPIVLTVDDTLVQTVGPGSSGYYFTFSDTIDSSPSTHYALTITAAATPISLQGALGSTTPLGAVTVSGTAGLSLGSSIDTYGGIVTLNPSVVLTGASTIDTTFASASGANIVFGSTVDGDQSLTLKAGSSGSITFSSDVGATPLSSLDVVSASLINIKNITVKGEINIPAPIMVSNASTAITSTSSGEIILGTIDGTTSGSQSLTVTTTGDVTLGIVGTTSLQNLTVTSGYVTLRSITATGTVDLEAKTILAESSTITGATILMGMLNGSTSGNQNLTLTGGAITLSGGVGTLVPLGSVMISGSSLNLGSSIYTYAQPITMSAPVTLSADVTLDTTDAPNAPLGADIKIESTVDGAKNFILIAGTSGDVTLSEDIGAGTPLTSLLVDSASDIILGQTVTLKTTGDLTLTPKVDAATSGVESLTLTSGGIITLGAGVGGMSPLNAFTILSGTKVLLSSITTSVGDISITPPVTLNGNATITSNNQAISFASTVSGSSYTFTVNAGSGSVGIGAITTGEEISLTGGAVSLNGAITTSGLSAGLTIMDSTSLSIISGDITIAGSFTQTGGGAVTLGNNITAGGGISFADQVSLTSNQTVYLTASGSPGIVLSGDVIGSGGGYNLVLTSYAYGVNAQNLGTDGNPLGILSLVSNVNSSFTAIAVVGIVEVFAPIVLTVDDTLVQTVGPGSSGYYFTFSDTIDSSPSTHYALTITAAATPISLQGALGSTTPLGAVTFSGTAGLSLGSSIDTYGGIVTLNPSVVLTGASTIDTTFASASGANIVFGSTVDGDQSLILKAGSSGSITFSSDVGATPLSSLDVVSASLINIKNITVKGEINIPAPIIVSDASTAITSTSSGEIILGTIDGTNSGAQSLTVITTGDVTLGIVGTTSLQNLTVTSGYVTLRSITATGTVDLEAKTILAESSTITGATILMGMLNGSTSGNQNLTLTGGAITLSGGVGTLVPLGSVIISGSSLNLGSSIYTYAQPITMSAPVTLSADVTLDTTDAPNTPLGADIKIESTVDGAKNFILIAGTSGDVTLSEDIGAGTPLTSLTISSASSVKSKNVTTTGSIIISPSIILSDVLTTFTSNSGGSVALGSMDGTSLGSQSLTVSTVGSVSLGAIGHSVPLVNVTVLTGTKATIETILVSGNITIDIPIVLASSAILNTTENGSTGSNITLPVINGTTVGGESLTVVAGSTGAVVFEGNIGSSSSGNPIGNLDVTGTSITFEGSTVVTKGTEAYHAPVLITQDITFTSLGSITFDSTVSPVSGNPSMTFSPGTGALTFTGNVASFNNIVVRNAGNFSSQAIIANDLVVAGGLGSIFINGVVTLGTPGVLILDGGPIDLGAEINAKLVYMHSLGNISNTGLPQPINVGTSSLQGFEVFNATKGVVGSIDSPIEINTPYTILVGASPRADFIGTPNHTGVREISFNPPCIVTFNGVTIVSCNPAASINRFPFLPKYLFYVPGLYSSWDNLSNREYFEEEPWALGSNPRDMKLMVLSSSSLNKEEKVHRTLKDKQGEVSSGPSKVAPKKAPAPKREPQPMLPQVKQEEKKEDVPQTINSQRVAPEEIKSAKVTVNVQVVAPEPLKQDLEQKIEKPSGAGVETPSIPSIPTNVQQKEEPVDWEFSIDFGKESRPLDLLPD